MRCGLESALVSVLIFGLVMLASAVPCAAQTDDEIGNEWVYSFRDEYYGMIFYGTWTWSCARITESPLGDGHPAVEYQSVLIATGSGLAMGNEYGGNMTMSEEVYMDADTYETIGFVSNQHIDMWFESYGDTSRYEYDEHNVTKYTPPGGFSTEPADISPGDSWSETYTKVSNASGYEDGSYFSDSVTWTETMELTFLGFETVSVPAGTFQCSKYEMSSFDGTLEMLWYASEVSSYAKIVDEYESGEILTYELASYSLEGGSGGAVIEMGSDLFIAALGFLVMATAAATVYASGLTKKQGPAAVVDMETGYMTRDGTRLSIRPISTSDERAWLDFVNGLSPDSSYHRFFEVLKGVTHSDAVHYLNIDREKRLALVAVLPQEKGGKMVAVARYELVPGTKTGEFAIVVADDYQDKGIGTFLLHQLSRYAKSAGVEEFVAEVLQDNERMMELFRHSGLRMESKLDSGTRLVRLFL